MGYGEFKSLREIAVPQGEHRRVISGGWRCIPATSWLVVVAVLVVVVVLEAVVGVAVVGVAVAVAGAVAVAVAVAVVLVPAVVTTAGSDSSSSSSSKQPPRNLQKRIAKSLKIWSGRVPGASGITPGAYRSASER